ncbi:MAG: hypothetical protein HY584_06200 [Candidatus Omnitrophica bacterium]|nr:hypothetical protein [Candidatus Omnitrophota bacterium]
MMWTIPSPLRTPTPLKLGSVFSKKMQEHASLGVQDCFLKRALAVEVMG